LRRLGQALNYKVIHFWHAGHLAAAIEAGSQGLAIAESQADVGLQVVANNCLGAAYTARGDCRNAVRHCEVALAPIPGDVGLDRFGQATIQGVFVRHTLAMALGALGRFAEAFGHLREAMHIAEQAGHALSLLFPLFSLGMLKFEQGDFAAAIAPLERGLELCRTREILLVLHDFTWALGAAYQRAGRHDDGIALMETAARGFAARNQRWSMWDGRVASLGAAYLLGGRLADTGRITQDGLAVARQQGERGVEGRLLRLLGDIATDTDTAEAHYQQARVIAEELSLRPLTAHCHLGLGKLYRRTSKSVQGREHLTIATTMYREMDMRFWLEQAEAELQRP
jgi:tetratricopeptide (TPR) repeat protein